MRILDKKNVNYPTLLRHINKLTKDGFIEEEKGTRRDGKVDERETKNLSLSFKGLVYLVLNANLTERESRAIVDRIFRRPEFQKLEIAKKMSVVEIPVASLKNFFVEIRPKINLEYFDEDWTMELLFENLILKNCLDEIIAWKEEIFKNLSKRELVVLAKKAKRDAMKLPEEWLNLLFAVYEYLRERQAVWNEKIDLLKPIVHYFRRTQK